MELTPSTLIALTGLAVVLLTTFAAIVGGFVRIESKVNALIEDNKEHFVHSSSSEIHHRADELDRRFTVITTQLADIKHDFKEGFNKLTERLDRMIEK